MSSQVSGGLALVRAVHAFEKKWGLSFLVRELKYHDE